MGGGGGAAEEGCDQLSVLRYFFLWVDLRRCDGEKFALRRVCRCFGVGVWRGPFAGPPTGLMHRPAGGDPGPAAHSCRPFWTRSCEPFSCRVSFMKSIRQAAHSSGPLLSCGPGPGPGRPALRLPSTSSHVSLYKLRSVHMKTIKTSFYRIISQYNTAVTEINLYLWTVICELTATYWCLRCMWQCMRDYYIRKSLNFPSV